MPIIGSLRVTIRSCLKSTARVVAENQEACRVDKGPPPKKRSPRTVFGNVSCRFRTPWTVIGRMIVAESCPPRPISAPPPSRFPSGTTRLSDFYSQGSRVATPFPGQGQYPDNPQKCTSHETDRQNFQLTPRLVDSCTSRV